jgi:DNA-binding HxlR family transcriptional regulator
MCHPQEMYGTAVFEIVKEAPMTEGTYNQFCPIAMASEILCTRWTLLLVRELLSGSKRFNELRRGVQRMSPALLSKRLKDLEAAGIVTRSKVIGEPGLFEYQLTKAGLELAPVIDGVGAWGHRWIKTQASLKNLDVNLLMWGIRSAINPAPIPARRTTIQVIFTDLPKARKNWWLIAQLARESIFVRSIQVLMWTYIYRPICGH